MVPGDQEDILAACQEYLSCNGWKLKFEMIPDAPSGVVYTITRSDTRIGPELPNPLIFATIYHVLAFTTGLRYGSIYGGGDG